MDFHTTRMFPTADKAPTKDSWIKEMSEGIKALGGEKPDEEEEMAKPDGDGEEESKEGEFKLKTRKQRKKALRQKGQAFLAKKLKEEQKLANDVFG